MSERVGNSRRAGIKYLLQFFLKTARQAIKSGKLDAEDMKYAKRAVDAIMEHRRHFMGIFRFIDIYEKFPTLDHHILNLLLAAYDIGKSGNATKSARICAFTDRQRDNGCASGKKRMEEAAEMWQPETKKLTEQKLKSDPTAVDNKAKIIRYVRDNWTLKCPLPKSDRQIDRFISTLKPIRERKLTRTGQCQT